MTRIALALVLVISLVAPAFADGMIVPVERRVPQIRDAFTVEYHLVTVDIDGQSATTGVDQAIKNVSGGLAQAIYMFPVPRGANISNFSMFIGEKEHQGEMMEAAKAREIYEQYVRKLIDPALLEYVGQGMYRTSVFPFQADETKRIRLKYGELLTRENGLVHYVYPLNTEKFSKYPLKKCRVEVNIKTDKPLRNVYSPTHEIEIKRIDDSRVQVVFEVTEARPTTDFEIYFSEDEGATGANLISYKPAGSEHGYFVYLVAPAKVESAARGKDIVFVCDTSGSMLEGGRLTQAKQALEHCLRNLDADDRINVVAFSDYINAWKEQVVEATPANVADAVAFALRLRGEGGTNIADAFARAFASFSDNAATRERMVIFLTDGRPTVGTRDDKAILEQVTKANAERRARVFNFAVGDDVNAVLLDWIARDNRGLTEYIRPGERIDQRVINFYDKVRNPVLADCKFEVAGVRVENLQPALMPDLFAGMQMVITGRYIGEGKATITYSGTRLGEHYERKDEVAFASAAASKDAHTWIEQLWAGRRIGQLLDQIRFAGKSQELIDEIVKLSKRYGIPTPYTSFLVLETDGPMPDANTMRRAAEDGFNNAMGGEGGGRWGARALDLAEEAQRQQGANRPPSAGVDDRREFRDKDGKRVTTTGVISILRKTFYWRDGQWVDESIAKDDAIAVTVKLLSAEYFALAAQHADLNRYAARGPVKLKLDGKVYSITAAE